MGTASAGQPNGCRCDCGRLQLGGALEGYFTGVGAADTRHDDTNTGVLEDYGVFFIGPPPVWSEWNS